MLSIKEISDKEEFEGLKNKWSELLKKSSSNNIFLTHEWLNTWWKYFGRGKNLKIIIIKDTENGILIGIAPLMLIKRPFFLRRLVFIGEHDSDYHDFIFSPGEEKRILDAVLKYLYTSQDWDVLQLKNIPQDSETLKVLDNNSIYWMRKTIHNICPTLKLPENWNDLLNMLSKQMRYNLKRYRKRLEKEFQVSFEDIENKNLLEGNMRDLFGLHQKSWTERGFKGIFIDSRIKDFLLDIANQFYDQGWLQLRVLKINEDPVSIYCNFKYNKKIYSYQAGRDPNWSKYSVGTLLLADIIENAIQNGYDEFDFLRGDEHYKESWKTQSRLNLTVELVNDRLSSKIKYKFLLFLRAIQTKKKIVNFFT